MKNKNKCTKQTKNFKGLRDVKVFLDFLFVSAEELAASHLVWETISIPLTVLLSNTKEISVLQEVTENIALILSSEIFIALLFI